MGTTPSGLWYPDAGTPLTPLDTVLATMQSSVEDALADVRSDLAASWPQISVASSGATRQVLPDVTVNSITGNSGGWAVTKNTGGNYMTATPGVGATPVHINAIGKYIVNFDFHLDVVSDNRAFLNVVTTGAQTLIRRTSFALDDSCSATAVLDIMAVPTSVGLQQFMDRNDNFSANLNAVSFDVYKMP